MSFTAIKGQDEAVDILTNAAARGKVSHAYIFYGPRGVGKRLAALAFAKLLNCQRAEPDRPCGECVACKKIGAMNHPDVFVIDQERAEGSIKIDAIRKIVENIALRPYEARKKVYIIDNAGYLTQEASNALLKTLEEPVSDSIIILIAEGLKDFLPTIISRSHQVRFKPLTPSSIEDILVKEYQVDGERARILAHIGCGSVGNALLYRDDTAFVERAQMIDGFGRTEFAETDFDGLSKHEGMRYCAVMLTWYRDIMLSKVSGGKRTPAIVNIDYRDRLSKEAHRLDMVQVTGIIKKIIETTDFLAQNSNPRLVMSALAAYIQERHPHA